MPHDPIAQFQDLFRRAQRAQLPLPDATALATAASNGLPSVRFVLLKQCDARGFVFFTDARSHKGRELRANRRAALAVYWHPLGRQVRIEGVVEPITPEESDVYWRTRPRPSRLAALSSFQSAPLASHAVLLARWARLRTRYRGTPIPRPPEWRGFRVVPRTIEFWTRGAHRLHHRELFTRTARGWKRQLLQP
jgi:pyridoxamine 5'-phosphate oxidase